MKVNIVIQPHAHKATRFGEYMTVGEALHVANHLKQHMQFVGDIWVEESPSLTDATLLGVPPGIVYQHETN